MAKPDGMKRLHALGRCALGVRGIFAKLKANCSVEFTSRGYAEVLRRHQRRINKVSEQRNNADGGRPREILADRRNQSGDAEGYGHKEPEACADAGT